VARRPPHIPEAWPRLMPAAVAAAYCGESSAAMFRRSVGTLWPPPRRVRGKGERWLREDLDRAIDRLADEGGPRDLADVL
jgi:hypothetical protein